MASYNHVTLMGNLTRETELRRTQSGVAVCTLGMAVNETFTKKNGETVEDTLFIEVIVWEKQAENCDKYLDKGSPVLVSGKLVLESWEKDGEKRSRIRVKADRVQFLGTPKKQEPNGNVAEPSEPDDGDDIPW